LPKKKRGGGINSQGTEKRNENEAPLGQGHSAPGEHKNMAEKKKREEGPEKGEKKQQSPTVNYLVFQKIKRSHWQMKPNR